MNKSWKDVEEWLYSHGFFDASYNLRDIKKKREIPDLLWEYEYYDEMLKKKK